MYVFNKATHLGLFGKRVQMYGHVKVGFSCAWIVRTTIVILSVLSSETSQYVQGFRKRQNKKKKR